MEYAKLDSYRFVLIRELMDEVKVERPYLSDREIFDYIMSDDYLLDECLKMVSELYLGIKPEFIS